jgi:hypothetical protein
MRSIRSGVVAVILIFASIHGGLAQSASQGGALSSPLTPGAPQTASIAGQVTDETGGAIPGADVTITDERGAATSAVSDGNGRFSVAGLAPGAYKIRIAAESFAPYENTRVTVVPGRTRTVDAKLRIVVHTEQVTVLSANRLMRGAEYRGSSLVLSGEALAALPDGPGGLQAMLRALALRSSGPFGPQLIINGFEGGRLPPKHSIREIRINDNPFSAEYAKLGLGRIEILTKPGTDKLRSEAHFTFGDESLNSRNPFAPNRASFQARTYGGNVSGPIIAKKLSFFVDFSRQETDSNAVVNATILDPSLNIIPFAQALVTPQRQYDFGPRLDWQVNAKHTVVARYSHTDSHALNSGIGELSLPSRAQSVESGNQTIQLTETAMLSARTINETRFQYVFNRNSQRGDNSSPIIDVPGAFTGGGADFGLFYDRERRADLENLTSRQAGRHVFKTGAQLKYINLLSGSDRNFAGTYTFGGRLAPRLNDRNEFLYNADGSLAMTQITTIEAYRRTLLFRRMGLSPAEIREYGGGATQFSISAGQPEAGVGQYQLGVFLQDDWRLHPRFSVTAGMRYEHQNNVSSPLNFAPRVGFVWGVGRGNKDAKTVVRGGTGVFYERVGERLVLRARQLNGTMQRQYIASDEALLDLFPNVPSPELFSAFATPRSVVRLAPDLRPPYTVHSSIAVERELPKGFSVAATYTNIRTLHMLRSRDINAPLPGSSSETLVRPFPDAANIFAYESTGIFKSHQLLANLAYYLDKRVSLWASYTFNDSRSDTEGAETFPANSYNLRMDYGRSALNALHSVYWGGWIGAKWGIELIPLGVWRTGMPYDVTTGRDNNGDSLFTDRPAFATDLARPSVVVNPYGAFDLNPLPGQQIIPRNMLFGPRFFISNLQLRKRFPLKERVAMTVSVQCQNLFNNTNAGLPVGNLSSSRFGVSQASAGDWGLGSNQAGNRRLELSVFFSF